MNILKDEQVGGYIFKARDKLKETAHDEPEYNAQEFVTFSKKILVELLEAQVRETLKMVLGKMNIRNFVGVYPEWAISDKQYKEFKQTLNQSGEE